MLRALDWWSRGREFDSQLLQRRITTLLKLIKEKKQSQGNICPPLQNREKYFCGKYHIKFGHFVSLSYIYFRAKCLAPNVDWAAMPMAVRTPRFVDRRCPWGARRSMPAAPRYRRPMWGRTPTSTWSAATRRRRPRAPVRLRRHDAGSGRLDARRQATIQRRSECNWDAQQELPCRRDDLQQPPTTPSRIRCVR